MKTLFDLAWVLTGLALIVFLSSCASMESGKSEFRAKDLFKNTLSYSLEISLNTTDVLLDEMATLLYKRNPKELEKSGLSLDQALSLIQQFNRLPTRQQAIQHLEGLSATDLVNRSLENQYPHDSILALFIGLKQMMMKAYGQREFYSLSEVTPQKIYDFGKNLEIAFWRVRNQEGLISYQADSNGEISQHWLQLEGRVMQIQDLMATIASQATRKAYDKRFVRIGTSFFFAI